MNPLLTPAIVAFTLCAWLCAHVVAAPKVLRRMILVAGLALIGAAQLLPGADPAILARRLAWTVLFLVPVLGYMALLRNLRRRAAPGGLRAKTQSGLARIDPDHALALDTRAALEAESARSTLSLVWRAASGAVAGHLRLCRLGATAEIELLFVDPDHRRQGIASRLLAAAEAEARDWGAARLSRAEIAPPEPELFLRAGFRAVTTRDLGAGTRHVWLEKDLA